MLGATYFLYRFALWVQSCREFHRVRIDLPSLGAINSPRSSLRDFSSLPSVLKCNLVTFGSQSQPDQTVSLDVSLVNQLSNFSMETPHGMLAISVHTNPFSPAAWQGSRCSCRDYRFK